MMRVLADGFLFSGIPKLYVESPIEVHDHKSAAGAAYFDYAVIVSGRE